MAANKHDIERMLDDARRKQASHLIVATDTYDYDDYPVFVLPTQDVHEEVQRVNGASMQRVTEVYSLTGKHAVADQLRERRAYYLD